MKIGVTIKYRYILFVKKKPLDLIQEAKSLLSSGHFDLEAKTH